MKTCPLCGAKALVHDTRDVSYTYKGQSTIIPAVEADYCASCGESVLKREAGDRFSSLVGEFQRQVNADLVDPAYVLAVRQRLNLSQREAGDIFGGGVNAFSRYETGKAQPSVALVKFLKLLERHPELVAEVAAM